MRHIYLLCLIPLIFSFSDATKIRTQDGTLYNGEIISENSNFLSLSVNGKRIQILKSIIVEIDAKRYTLRTDNHDTVKNRVIDSKLSDVNSTKNKRVDSVVNSGSDVVTVILKNGTIFKGPMISHNDRIIILNVNGSPVNIFKSIISEIITSEKQINSTSEGKNGENKPDSSLNKLSLQIKREQNSRFYSDSGSKKDSSNTRNDSAVLNLYANKGKTAEYTKSVGNNVTVENTENAIIDSNQTNVKRSDEINNVNKPAQKILSAEGADLAHSKTDSDKSKKTLLEPVNSKPLIESEVKKGALNTTEVSRHKSSISANMQKETAIFNKTASGSDSVSIKNDTQSKLPVTTVSTAGKDLIYKNNVNTVASEKNTDNKANANNNFAKSNNVTTTTAVTFPAKIEKKKVQQGDKVEIVLKNGANFLGKIIYEDERIIRFEVGEAVINILKHLIKEIDGVTYDKGTIALQEKNVLATGEEGTIKKNSLSDRADTIVELIRTFPKIPVPENVQVVQLKDSLHSISPEQRSQAARTLAAIGQWGADAIPDLNKLLGDTALSTSLGPVLIDSLNVNQILSPGDEAARALSRMGPTGFSVLKMALKNENSLVRRRAAFGLGELSTETAFSALMEALNDSDHNVRAVAVSGLRSVKFADVLMSMLKDENATVKANAAFMLGKMRENKSIKSLRALLYDHHSYVRVRAAEALCMIGGKEASSVLIDATIDSDFNVRENAAYALGEIGDSIAVQPLINLLRDKIATVRSAAITALSKIKDPRSIPSLYSMLKDKEVEIRQQTEVALKELTDVSTLIKALDNKNSGVRKNVYYLLWLMTGQDIEMDKTLWQNWYSESQTTIKKTTKK